MVIISGALATPPGTIETRFGWGVEGISTNVTATWSWYDESKGIVSWNFKSGSVFQETVILYRSGYYFGEAFWPIYIANGISSWATQISPLVNKGVEKNTMPLGIVDFGNGQRIIAFVFTLGPKQSWNVLEGGFTTQSPPASGILYGARLERTGQFCIGYDTRQVTDWDRQTSTSLKGYRPNPSNIRTLEVSISILAPYIKLFPKDMISDSLCADIPKSMQEAGSEAGTGDIEEIVGNIIQRIRSF